MILGAGRQIYPADHVFDRGDELGCYTLELTYSGTMLRRSGNMRRARPQPNDTLLLTPPGTPYALRGRDEGEEIWLIFEPRAGIRELLDWPVGSFGIPELMVPRTPLGRQILRAFEDANEYVSGRFLHKERLAENALERLVLLASRLRSSGRSDVDDRVSRTLDLIHADYAAPMCIATMAAAVALSPSRFAHLFRRETGVSPMAYMEGVRLEQAQQLLLRTSLMVKEIGARVGFDDPYYFSTRFRRRFGRSPAAWRKCPTP